MHIIYDTKMHTNVIMTLTSMSYVVKAYFFNNIGIMFCTGSISWNLEFYVHSTESAL